MLSDPLTYRETFPTEIQDEHTALLAATLTFTGVFIFVTMAYGVLRGVKLSVMLMLVQWAALLCVGIVSWVVTYLGTRSVIEESEEDVLTRSANSVAEGIQGEFATGVGIAQLLNSISVGEHSSFDSTWPTPHWYIAEMLKNIAPNATAIFLVYAGDQEGRMFGVQPLNAGRGETAVFLNTFGMDPIPSYANCSAQDFSEQCPAYKASGHCGDESNSLEWECRETCGAPAYSHRNCMSSPEVGRLSIYKSNLVDGVFVAPEGYDGSPVTQLPAYDPRSRPWYHNLTVPIWSEPYAFFAEDHSTGLTVSVALYEAGVHKRTTAVDYNLGSLNSFMSGLKISSNAVSFLMSMSGIVVGTSLTPDELKEDSGWDYVNTRVLNTSEFNNSMSRITATLTTVLGRFNTIEAASGQFALIHHRSTIVMSKSIEVSGLKLMMFVTLPYSDVMGEADEASLVSLLLTVCISIACALLVFGGVTFILCPLKTLAQAMMDVAEMNLEGHDEAQVSLVSEVSAMNVSFAKMVKNLVVYRQYLPQSVLCETDDDTDALTAHSNDTPRIGISSARSQHSVRSLKYSASASSSQLGAKVAQIISTRLKLNNITLAVLNVKGFHAIAKHTQPLSLVKFHAEYVQRIAGDAKLFRGIIDEFRGDHVQVSFNALLSNPVHRFKSVEMCLKVVRTFDVRPGTSGVETENFNPRLNAALIGCRAMCGNMGSTGIKKFTLIAAGVSALSGIERWGSRWGLDVLVEGTVARDVELGFRHRCIAKVEMSDIWTTSVHEVLGSIGNEGDAEWMYQAEVRDGCPYTSYNEALDALYEGNLEEASRLLEKCDGCEDNHTAALAKLIHKLELSDTSVLQPLQLSAVPDMNLARV